MAADSDSKSVVEGPPSSDASWILRVVRAGAPRPEHEVPAIGQELRPAVRLVLASFVERGHGRRGAAAGARAKDRGALVGREQDGAVAPPRTAVRRRRVGDFVDLSRGERDRLELAAGEEAERAAVGRPEHSAGARARRAFERLRLQRVEAAHHDFVAAIARDEGDAPAVGRHGRRGEIGVLPRQRRREYDRCAGRRLLSSAATPRPSRWRRRGPPRQSRPGVRADARAARRRRVRRRRRCRSRPCR